MAKRSSTHPIALAGFPLLLLLTGCNGAESQSEPQRQPQPATLTVVADLSRSTPFYASTAYAQHAVAHTGALVIRQRLGDTVRVVPMGARHAEHAAGLSPIATGRRSRLHAARKKVEASLNALFAQSRAQGGDGSTNILYALENMGISCTPGSALVLLSDGIEASDSYSVTAALASGNPVQLPLAPHAYLKGCRVDVIGIGVSSGDGSTAETLPNEEVQRLTDAWRGYLQSAGVKPDAMRFVSIL